MLRRLIDLLRNDDYQEIITKGFSFLLIRVFGAIISYIFIMYITNIFGPEIYGLIALSFSMFMIISVFGRLGLDTNIIKFFSQDINDSESGIFFKAILESFSVTSVIALILYWFREELVLNLYQDPKPELLLYLPWVLASIPIWNVAIICTSYMRAKRMNNSFAFLENPSRFFFSLIILVGLFIIEKDPLVIVKAHLIGVLLTALISFVLVVRRLPTPTLISRVNTWQFTQEALPMLFSSTILILLGMMDTQIMGIFESKAEVGIYNVSLKIATLTGFSLQAVNSILAPKIAKFYGEGVGDYKKLISFSTKLNFLISSLTVLVITLFRETLLGFFGESFIKGELILLVFCVGQIINSFSGSVGVILQMIGKQRVYQNFVLVALLLNLLLTFILTPVYGGVGAAVATVISMAFWNIGSSIYLKRKMNITTYYNFK